MSGVVTRRTVLSLLGGAALGGVGGTGLSVAGSSPSEDRYVIDTRDAPSGWDQDVEVIHDLRPIDVAVVRAGESDLSGLQYVEDIEVEVSPPVTGGESLSPTELSSRGSDLDSHESGPPAGYFLFQWDKYEQNIDQVHSGVSLPGSDEAVPVRGDGARIGIIDSGILANHPEFEDNLDFAASRNFTGDGADAPGVAPGERASFHGTNVAGIAAAGGDLVLGSAPEADLVDLRVFSGPFATTGDIVAAIVYGALPRSSDTTLVIGGEVVSGGAGCDVLNLSLGAYPIPKGVESAPFEDFYERGAALALENGTLPVAAAGNDGANLDADGDVVSYPNEADGFMSVSATGPIGFRWDDPGADTVFGGLQNLQRPTTAPAFFTNYGAEAVDVSAGGGNADLDTINQSPSTSWFYDLVFNAYGELTPDGPVPSYSWLAGTSMASPQVAGLAALLKSLYPDASPDTIRAHIEATAQSVPAFGNAELSSRYRGNGHIDVMNAVTTSPTALDTTNAVFETALQVGDEEIGPPQDLDGDGLYEDVNGDGTFDMDDVRALYHIVNHPVEVESRLDGAQRAALDFAGDGELDDADAQALLRMLRRNGGGSA